MLRVAAYCRVSTDKEDQSNSLESQQRYFRTYIEQNPNWELQQIYADEGISGTCTKKRKQFNAMIRDAREGNLDLILTKEVSRFARNTVDTLEYTRELRRRGISVLFLNDNINSMDADGEFRLTIMASVAQEESRKTSNRVKWGQTRSMERGVVFGGSLLGYDVRDGSMTVNPTGAKTVRYIFHKYINERKGTGVIANELLAEGIPSSRGNLNWSASTVLKILKNEKYCGDLIQKKTYTPDYLSHEKKYNRGEEEAVVLRDHHEPIIDRETWNAVQNELARRKRHHTQHREHGNCYPLSGKIKCGHCGSSFLSRTKKSKNGSSYRVWRCGKATTEGRLRIENGLQTGCDIGRQIREDIALDIVKRTVAALETDSDGMIRNLTHITHNVRRNDYSSEKHRLEKELEGERRKKQRALEEFLAQTISDADFRFLNGCCDRRMDEITERIADLETQNRHEGTESDIRTAICGIVSGKTAPDMFYGQLLHHMIVDSSGRVEVALNLLPDRWFYQLAR